MVYIISMETTISNDNAEMQPLVTAISGEKLREHRLRLRLSVKELAAYLDCTIQQIAHYEAGRSAPSVGRLLRMMELYRITDIRELLA